MKVGDLVWVIGTMTDKDVIGTVVEMWENANGYDGYGWWTIMIGTGELIHWPMRQLELVNESR